MLLVRSSQHHVGAISKAAATKFLGSSALTLCPEPSGSSTAYERAGGWESRRGSHGRGVGDYEAQYPTGPVAPSVHEAAHHRVRRVIRSR